MAAARYHWLKLRAVAHPTEVLERVRQAVRVVSGLDADAFAAATTVEAIETHHGLTLHVVETTVEKSRAVRDALDRILELPGARERLATTLERRVDDDGILYVRLEKQEAAQGRLVLQDTEDAVQVRLKMESYPATREAALAALAAMLAAPRA